MGKKFFKKKRDLYTPEQRAAYRAAKEQPPPPAPAPPAPAPPAPPSPPAAPLAARAPALAPARVLSAPHGARRNEWHYPLPWREGAPTGRFVAPGGRVLRAPARGVLRGFDLERTGASAPLAGAPPAHEQPAVMLPHAGVRRAFELMDARGVFADATQPMGLGTACAPTYVTRTLSARRA